jgi:DNA-binding Lrp family transcriptional regulator
MFFMDENHFMLVSLEDSKSKSISEVLGSKTCKKIISYLSEKKEASQKDLSNALSIPMNTLDYNIKKLLDSGFIQKRKNFFWSQKGKKIVMYGLSNKSIVISSKKTPSQKLKSILPAFILTIAGTFAIWAYEKIKYATNNLSNTVSDSAQTLLSKGAEIASSSVPIATMSGSTIITPQPTPIWAWFLAGALLMIVIISIINWSKL